jgi:hypothetical protein
MAIGGLSSVTVNQIGDRRGSARRQVGETDESVLRED